MAAKAALSSRLLAAAVGAWTLLALPGCVSEFERDALAGRSCPCLAGWICDESAGAAGICVPESEAAGGSSSQGSNGGSANTDGGAALNDAGLGPPAGGASGSAGSECELAAAANATDCPPECDECTDGTCHIRCDEARDCSGTLANPLSLNCPPGMHCQVSCSSDDNCNVTEVHCSGDQACDVSCTGRRSCIGASLGCADGPCALHCGGEARVCRDSIVLCGSGACQASCEGIVLPTVVGCENSCSSECGC